MWEAKNLIKFSKILHKTKVQVQPVVGVGPEVQHSDLVSIWVTDVVDGHPLGLIVDLALRVKGASMVFIHFMHK